MFVWSVSLLSLFHENDSTGEQYDVWMPSMTQIVSSPEAVVEVVRSFVQSYGRGSCEGEIEKFLEMNEDERREVGSFVFLIVNGLMQAIASGTEIPYPFHPALLR